ncbi:MAG TPA: OsmC family protein [Streptosporangiaceae bacterium]
MIVVDLRAIQRPYKQGYREDPSTARITLTARGAPEDTPMACSVDLGRAIYAAEAHPGVGGAGTAACSGDLLLGALAACAQLTCQMVATAMGIELDRIEVTVEGDLDLRGTLGMSDEAPVGFSAIRVMYDLDAPGVSMDRLDQLKEKAERYCVVMQTLTESPPIDTAWRHD